MEKQWADMSSDEKQEAFFARWMTPKDHEGNDLKFQSPQAEKAFKERITRIKDAIQMKKLPDRAMGWPRSSRTRLTKAST